MRAALASLLVLAAALAGCTVESPVLEGLPPPGAGSLAGPGPGFPAAGLDAANASLDPNATFAAPAPWELRQWWRFNPSNSEIGPDTRVVVADQGNAWLVGTSNPQIAYFDARFDISTLGRVRKADVAGEQREGAVEFFRFPLTTNATWSTFWDGQMRQVTVLGPQNANVGGKTYPAMLLEAREGDRVAVRYNYVPAAGWFSFVEFLNPGGTFALTMVDFGRGYNGTIAGAAVQEVLREGGGDGLAPHATFQVPQGQDLLDLEGTFRGDTVAYELTFVLPDQSTLGPFTIGPCTANCSEDFEMHLPATPGAWTVLATGHAKGGAVPAWAELVATVADFTERRLS